MSSTNEEKNKYLLTQLERTYLPDIIDRNRIKNDDELEELLDIIRTDKYSKFIELIKQGKVEASGYYVSKNIFGKEVVKESSWWDSHTIKEKNFKEFEIKKYIRFCDAYTLDNIRNDLSAEQFLDWCKDHKADTLKVEVVKK